MDKPKYRMIKVVISDTAKYDAEEGCTVYLYGCQVMQDKSTGKYFLKVPFTNDTTNSRAYENDWLICFEDGSFSVYNVTDYAGYTYTMQAHPMWTNHKD